MKRENNHKYLRIQEFVRDGIKSGAFTPGDRLPSEASLSHEFSTTRSTVAHALQLLVFEGLITREVGRGTFVKRAKSSRTLDVSRVRSFDEEMDETGSTIEYKLLTFCRLKVPQKVGWQLKISEEDELYNIIRLRLVDGRPAVLENRYIPVDIASKFTIDDLGKYSIYVILDEKIGMPVSRIDGVIGVAAALPDVANHLRIKQGSPVLVRDYVLRGLDGRPLVAGEAFYCEQYLIRYTTVQD